MKLSFYADFEEIGLVFSIGKTHYSPYRYVIGVNILFIHFIFWFGSD